MQTVTDPFLRALTQSHTMAYSCTLTSPGTTTPLGITLAGGQVAASSGQIIRRTATLQAVGGSDLWDRLAVPGAVITIKHGIDYGGGSKELVPMIVGELSSAAAELGDGLIGVSLADYGQRVQASPFLTTYSPSATAGRLATVSAAITSAVSAAVSNTASDTATVGTNNSWSADRAAMISALLTDAGAEGYFLPDGTFQIRDLPQITDTPVWTFKTGPGGTIKTFSRNRALDKLYNTVIVQPLNLDGSQTWTQVVAQISDTGNPRHPNYIGVRPYTFQSPTILTAAAAQQVAGQILTRLQGSSETLALGAVSNPALDVGDVIRATNITDGGGIEILTHLIDSLNIDILTGDMTVSTRSSQEVFA